MELLGAGERRRSSTRRRRSRPATSRWPAVRSRQDASIVQAAAAVADGRADALVSAGSTGPTLAAGTVLDQAHPRRLPARAGRAAPDAGRAGAAARRRRERGGAARAPRPVRLHGRVLHGGRATESSARGWACCRSARSPARARPTCMAAHERLAERRARLRRQRRGLRPPARDGRRGGGRRLHRQRRAEGARGHRRRCSPSAIRRRGAIGPGVERSAAC